MPIAWIIRTFGMNDKKRSLVIKKLAARMSEARVLGDMSASKIGVERQGGAEDGQRPWEQGFRYEACHLRGCDHNAEIRNQELRVLEGFWQVVHPFGIPWIPYALGRWFRVLLCL